ncbi:MAG: AAA family ATPase [bacterium]|nr:AAA family ATPase [bacterium]
MKKLIAIVGMAGSGKSVATDYLESLGFKKIYFGGLTYKLMKEAKIEVTPDGRSEKEFRESLRQKYGKECYAKLLLPDILTSLEKTDVVLDGLYSWDEYKFLQDKVGNRLKLIAIIADKNIRYERVAIRKERPLKKEDVIYRDISEIENLAKGGPIAFSDYYVLNNGNISDYKKRIGDILNSIEQEGEM